MRSALLLVSVLCGLLTSVSGFLVTVGRSQRQCFYENLKKGDKMGVNYQVEHGGSLDIDLTIKDPQDEIVHSDTKQYAGSTQFVATKDGKYTYCFFNGASSAVEKEVSFHVVGTPYFGNLYPSLKKDDTLGPVDKEIRVLNINLHAIKEQQYYIASRERVHRDTAESTNSRVLWWSVFQLIVLASVCFWQVYYLKQFFEVKRVI